MADVDGLASTEIAELLDLSPGTVRAYLHEARQALRRILVAFRGDGT
jgi:DNA-directed RNA polymerase specialized sigma24 family protein